MSSYDNPRAPRSDVDDPPRVERLDDPRGPYDPDPLVDPVGHVDPADPVARAHDSKAARTVPIPRTDVGDRPVHAGDRPDIDHRETPEVVKDLREPDNRAKLLLLIAGLSALTFILVLVNTITLQSQAGDEPILVDGVPCLVDEAAGEGEEAVLYCQR